VPWYRRKLGDLVCRPIPDELDEVEDCCDSLLQESQDRIENVVHRDVPQSSLAARQYSIGTRNARNDIRTGNPLISNAGLAIRFLLTNRENIFGGGPVGASEKGVAMITRMVAIRLLVQSRVSIVPTANLGNRIAARHRMPRSPAMASATGPRAAVTGHFARRFSGNHAGARLPKTIQGIEDGTAGVPRGLGGAAAGRSLRGCSNRQCQLRLADADHFAAKGQGLIAVASGQTVLPAGLNQEQKDVSHSGIPLRDQLPTLGEVVGNAGHNIARTELIIFIRPQIIRDSVDAHYVAEELRRKLKVTLAPVLPYTGPAPRAR
jgi:hypothetical protein